MILPGGHFRHERQRLGFQRFAILFGQAARLPRNHALEALFEGLQLAPLVDAILTILAPDRRRRRGRPASSLGAAALGAPRRFVTARLATRARAGCALG